MGSTNFGIFFQRSTRIIEEYHDGPIIIAMKTTQLCSRPGNGVGRGNILASKSGSFSI